MSALDDIFTNIANAIRAKTGKSSQITPVNMPTEISSIYSGEYTYAEYGAKSSNPNPYDFPNEFTFKITKVPKSVVIAVNVVQYRSSTIIHDNTRFYLLINFNANDYYASGFWTGDSDSYNDVHVYRNTYTGAYNTAIDFVASDDTTGRAWTSLPITVTKTKVTGLMTFLSNLVMMDGSNKKIELRVYESVY